MAKERMPEWAKRLEEWGKGMEMKYGSSSKESCHSEQTPRHSREGGNPEKEGMDSWPPTRNDKRRTQNPVGDIVGQFISYLLITYAPVYFPGFFLDGWSAVYTVFIFAIVIRVAVDLLLILLTAKPFYYLGQVVMNLAGLVSMVVMVTIFPFNFPGNIGSIVQFALWIAIVVVTIVTFFDFLKIFSTSGE